MTPRHAQLIRTEVAKVSARPDLKEALVKVLDEAADIITTDAPEPATAQRKHDSTRQASKTGGSVDIQLDDPPEVPQPAAPQQPIDADPLRALAAESPELLTKALDNENARTISLLLNSMDVEAAGQVFKRLPGAKRKEVSVCFTEQNAINPELIGHIAQAVVRKCQTLRSTMTASAGAGEAGGRDKRVASLLRGLERAERMETLAVLEETDAELATRVKSMLYQFEDILRMDNPSVQKLLSDIDMKSLALAMSGAPPEIHERLLKNLSKRAQESLKEEVELMGTVQAARVQQARQSIVEAIQRLDQRGELVLME
jgi:flagellar motor switch protein FliG